MKAVYGQLPTGTRRKASSDCIAALTARVSEAVEPVSISRALLDILRADHPDNSQVESAIAAVELNLSASPLAKEPSLPNDEIAEISLR